ncbi:MAG: recG [Patescibacteria group bacterium]|nr:recG [Patescibacteria group bacterium]
MKSDAILEKIFRLTDDQKKALKRLGILNAKDLLYHFPTRYSDMTSLSNIDSAEAGSTVTLYGKLSKLETKKGFKTKIAMGTATLTDFSGSNIKVVWMNQAYIAKMYRDGETVKLTGKISDGKYGKSLMNPEIERAPDMPIDVHDSLFQAEDAKSFFGYPVYAETKGITSKWFYHSAIKLLKQNIHQDIPDPIPADILKKYNLPSLADAMMYIHMPKSKEHADAARKRFAFEEIFLIQLHRQYDRHQYDELFSYKLKVDKKEIKEFESQFPFKPTDSQRNAIDAVLNDFQSDKPMSRLIEGDVGSGKTFVAAVAAFATIQNTTGTGSFGDFGNLQVAYMAPTEVLATQLFENFVGYFKDAGIQIGLITGSGCRKFPTKVFSSQKPWTEISRTQLLKWIKNGEIPIVIGTHALIQKSVEFQDLGLVIIDEQHRFGTNQRKKLAKKEGHAPHYLSMTATPIPRTLALTLYGDLDLTVIDQMPSGRKPVITKVVPDAEAKRNEAYEAIRKELQDGRQAYVICPRIAEPDPDKELALNLKSVTSEAARLQKNVFPKFKIGIMHSKMTPKAKDDVMKQFSNHEIDILVSTSVVEVGVNVPNATNIIIEGAERFGLAQLHQLRGRVIRGNHQAYCYLFADAKSAKTAERLAAFLKAKNGFELAELDLAQRGAGDLAGIKQWGISDIGMEAIKNIKMVEFARTEAQLLVKEDPKLENHPLQKKIIEEKNFEIHFE